MNKKLVSLGLGAALAVSLSAPALAFETPLLISAPAPAEYSRKLIVNGNELDTTGLPFATGIPMRLLAENDYGSANWYEEENLGMFYLDGNAINISFATNEVTLDDAVLSNAGAEVIDGVTFMQPEAVNGLPGYSVKETEDGAWEISTPNGQPMTKLAREIMAELDMGSGMKASPKEMEEYHGISADNFTEVVGFFPMMISPDTVVIAKLAEGKAETAQTQFEEYRKAQEATFEWYLAQNLPKVQNAQCVVNGEYILFVIGGAYPGEYAAENDPDYVFPEDAVNAEKAVEMFNTWVAQQTAQ